MLVQSSAMTTPEHERFLQALSGAARAWRLALDRRLKHLGLSQASWLTIAAVARGDVTSQAKLAAELGVEQPTMVAMVDRLVKDGYLMRVASVSDRRVKRIELTVKGDNMRTRLSCIVDQFLDELFCDMDDQRIEVVTILLESVCASIGLHVGRADLTSGTVGPVPE